MLRHWQGSKNNGVSVWGLQLSCLQNKGLLCALSRASHTAYLPDYIHYQLCLFFFLKNQILPSFGFAC